jgi:hypothetical protein
MLKIILIAVVVLVAVFIGIVAMQPAEYRIVRSAVIAAPAPIVFEQLNDFHKWETWSPWAKLDPNAKNTFDGPASGPGAMFSWAGNKKVGEGRMTVLESRPSDLVRIKLEFIKPFASSCTTEFALAPQGNQTAVTWAMFGVNNFMAKAFCMFMNMDKTVGPDFERGLAQMKAVAEKAVAAVPKEAKAAADPGH